MHLIEALDATLRDIARDSSDYDAKNPESRVPRAVVADCFRMLKQRLEEKGPQTLVGSPTPLVTGNKSIDDILRFFKWEHLPPELQETSKRFAVLAYQIAEGPHNAETTTALRKLMEAKDAAVRAQLVNK
jgi:hypothetical protein